MISDDDWSALADAARGRSGVASRRIYPTSGHDLYMAVRQPGQRRCLWYDVPLEATDALDNVPSMRSINIEVGSMLDDTDSVRCELSVTGGDLGEVFTRFVDDVSAAVAASQTVEMGSEAFVGRLHRWRRLLERGPQQGLTPEESRGLVGELVVMGRLIDEGFQPLDVITGWTGPLSRDQDFQLAGIAIEVKATSAKQPHALRITSERQLDTANATPLFLVIASFDERRGGDGESLPEWVEGMRFRLAALPNARHSFDDLLGTVGYLDEQAPLYGEPRYSVRTLDLHRVDGEFPRITERDLPAGIGDVSYRIQVSAMQTFECEWSDVIITAERASDESAS